MPLFSSFFDKLEEQLLEEVKERNKMPLRISSSEFKSLFVPQFLATMAANRFNDYCSRNMQEEISSLPFEDAEFLAEEVYKKYYEFKNG